MYLCSSTTHLCTFRYTNNKAKLCIEAVVAICIMQCRQQTEINQCFGSGQAQTGSGSLVFKKPDPDPGSLIQIYQTFILFINLV